MAFVAGLTVSATAPDKDAFRWSRALTSGKRLEIIGINADWNDDLEFTTVNGGMEIHRGR